MEHFREAGEQYGYPSCCIDSFISDVKTGFFLIRPDRKLDGTGFVPCAICNEKYTEDELVDVINSSRLHSKPFSKEVIL